MAFGDIVYIAVTLLLVGILSGVTYFMLTTLNDSSIGTTFSQQIVDGWGILDTTFIILTIVFAMAAIMLAYFVPTSPVFFVVMVVEILFILIFIPTFSNAYAMIAQTPALADAFDVFPNIAWILGNLPLFSLLIAGAVAFVQYGKNPQGELRGIV